MRQGIWALVATPLALAASGPAAHAAGFALKEQSAAAQGNAFAGATAGAEDVSYMFFNPAALGRLEGSQALATASLIIPNSELTDADGTTVLGAPIGGTATLEDIGLSEVVPAFYVMTTPVEPIRFGLGINVPFGLETDYPDGWVGRYHATNSRLRSVNINPSVALPLSLNGGMRATFGAGLQAQYIEADLSNAIDLDTISQAGGGPPVPLDGRVQVKGDDWGFGFTAGVLWEFSPSTRLGVAYRSGLDQTLRGDADFTLPAAVGGAFGPLFTDTDASAQVTLPDTASIGFYTDVGHGWAVMGDVAWTNWSTFDDLTVEFDNPDQPDSTTTENWHDSLFLALGASYRPRDDLILRLGVAHDQTPIEATYRTPRIPGNDRYWGSVGLTWNPLDAIGLDLAYTYIYIEDSEVRLTAAGENQLRGSLNASYENDIHLLTIAAKVRF